MFNYRWSCSGTLDEICQSLHDHHFNSKIFLIVSRDEGWYQIDNDTWLMIKIKDNWQLYYWSRPHDPRPFLRIVSNLRGFDV